MSERLIDKLEINIRRYTIIPGDHIIYHVEASFLGITWGVDRRYQDFADFHKMVCGLYSAKQCPYLTGGVPPWKNLNEETAWKRMPKLETYLRDLRDMSAMWPSSDIVTVPHPDTRESVPLNKHMERLFMFRECYVPKSMKASGNVFKDEWQDRHEEEVTVQVTDDEADALPEDDDADLDWDAPTPVAPPKEKKYKTVTKTVMVPNSAEAQEVWTGLDEESFVILEPTLSPRGLRVPPPLSPRKDLSPKAMTKEARPVGRMTAMAAKMYRVLTGPEVDYLVHQLSRYDDDDDMIKFFEASRLANTVVLANDLAPPFPPSAGKGPPTVPPPPTTVDSRLFGVTCKQAAGIAMTLYFFDTRLKIMIDQLVPILTDFDLDTLEDCFGYYEDIDKLRRAIS